MYTLFWQQVDFVQTCTVNYICCNFHCLVLMRDKNFASSLSFMLNSCCGLQWKQSWEKLFCISFLQQLTRFKQLVIYWFPSQSIDNCKRTWLGDVKYASFDKKNIRAASMYKQGYSLLLIFFSTSLITCCLQRSSIYIEMHRPGIHSRFNECLTLCSHSNIQT
jgi:hypothetical protein